MVCDYCHKYLFHSDELAGFNNKYDHDFYPGPWSPEDWEPWKLSHYGSLNS